MLIDQIKAFEILGFLAQYQEVKQKKSCYVQNLLIREFFTRLTDIRKKNITYILDELTAKKAELMILNDPCEFLFILHI